MKGVVAAMVVMVMLECPVNQVVLISPPLCFHLRHSTSFNYVFFISLNSQIDNQIKRSIRIYWAFTIRMLLSGNYSGENRSHDHLSLSFSMDTRHCSSG